MNDYFNAGKPVKNYPGYLEPVHLNTNQIFCHTDGKTYYGYASEHVPLTEKQKNFLNNVRTIIKNSQDEARVGSFNCYREFVREYPRHQLAVDNLFKLRDFTADENLKRILLYVSPPLTAAMLALPFAIIAAVQTGPIAGGVAALMAFLRTYLPGLLATGVLEGGAGLLEWTYHVGSRCEEIRNLTEYSEWISRLPEIKINETVSNLYANDDFLTPLTCNLSKKMPLMPVNVNGNINVFNFKDLLVALQSKNSAVNVDYNSPIPPAITADGCTMLAIADRLGVIYDHTKRLRDTLIAKRFSIPRTHRLNPADQQYNQHVCLFKNVVQLLFLEKHLTIEDCGGYGSKITALNTILRKINQHKLYFESLAALSGHYGNNAIARQTVCATGLVERNKNPKSSLKYIYSDITPKLVSREFFTKYLDIVDEWSVIDPKTDNAAVKAQKMAVEQFHLFSNFTKKINVALKN